MDLFTEAIFSAYKPGDFGETCILCEKSFDKKDYGREYICPRCKVLWKELILRNKKPDFENHTGNALDYPN